MYYYTNIYIVKSSKILIYKITTLEIKKIFFLCPYSLLSEPPIWYSLRSRVVVHRIRSSLLAQHGIQGPSKYLNLSLERRVRVNQNAQESWKLFQSKRRTCAKAMEAWNLYIMEYLFWVRPGLCQNHKHSVK